MQAWFLLLLAATVGSAFAAPTRLVPQLGHNGGVQDMALSPDGTRLATSSSDGAVILWDARSGAMLLRAQEDQGRLAFSPDGSLLVIATPVEILLLDVKTGRSRRRLENPHQTPILHALRFSPDGRWFATGGSDGHAVVWEAATGASFRWIAHDHAVFDLAFSADSRTLITANGRHLTAWDVATGERRHHRKGHRGRINSVRWSHDGTQLVTASEDRTARLWDAAKLRPRQRLGGHLGGATTASFSPDDQVVASTAYHGYALIWDAKNGRKQAFLDYQPDSWGRPHQIAWSPKGSVVISGGGTAEIWTPTFDRHRSVIGDFPSFSADGQHLFTTQIYGPAYRYDAAGEPQARFDSKVQPAREAVLSPSGDALLVRSWPHATVWNLQQGHLQARFGSKQDCIWQAAYADGGRAILTLGCQGAKLRDARTGRVLATLSEDDGANGPPPISPDGQHALLIGNDGLLEQWDLRSGQRTRTLHEFGVTQAAYSPDGRRVAMAAGNLWLLDTATGEVVAQWSQDEGDGTLPLARIAWSADSTQLLAQSHAQIDVLDVATMTSRARIAPDGVFHGAHLSARADRVLAEQSNTLVLWDVETSTLLHEFKGLEFLMFLAAMSPDGRWVAADSIQEVYLWESATGAREHVLRGHIGGITSLSFSPDSRHLITTGRDGTTRLWDTASGSLRATLLAFHDGSWAVVDDEGRYDASHDGDIDGLVWVIGDEAYRLSQLQDAYYEPGLLAKAAGRSAEPLRDVPALSDAQPPPRIHLDGPHPLRRGRSDFHLGELPAALRDEIPVGRVRPIVVRTMVLAQSGQGVGDDAAQVSAAVDRAVRDQATGAQAPIVAFDMERLNDAWQLVGVYQRQGDALQLEGAWVQLGTEQRIEVRLSEPDAHALAHAAVQVLVEAIN